MSRQTLQPLFANGYRKTPRNLLFGKWRTLCKFRKKERETAQLVLQSLIKGKLLVERQGKFTPRNYRETPHKETSGTVMLAREGYGFVKIEGEEEDIFIPIRN